MTEDTHKIPAHAGAHIADTITAARQASALTGKLAEFGFNGVTVYARADSNPVLLRRDYDRALAGQHEGAVGPHPAPKLPPDVLARDAEIAAETAARRAEQAREWDRAGAQKRARLDAEIGGVDLALSDAEGWAASVAANPDGYGRAAMDYADAWGRLMQARTAGGAPLAEVASQASHDADVFGISGFQHSCAKSILVQTWCFGGDLEAALDTRSYSAGQDV